MNTIFLSSIKHKTYLKLPQALYWYIDDSLDADLPGQEPRIEKLGELVIELLDWQILNLAIE